MRDLEKMQLEFEKKLYDSELKWMGARILLYEKRDRMFKRFNNLFGYTAAVTCLLVMFILIIRGLI